MTTLVSAVNTVFTPAVGDFNVQATGAPTLLQRRNTAGAGWITVGNLNESGGIVSNPIAATDYRFISHNAAAVVQADQ